MIFHLRCDQCNEQHTYITVFCNHANTGRLVMNHDEAIALRTALEHAANIEIKVSGHWPGEQAT